MRAFPLCFLIAIATGCTTAGSHNARQQGVEEIFGLSVEGRDIRGTVFGTSGPCSLLFAVIHGDEPLGKPLLERFMAELRARPELVRERRIIVIPVVNPDGLHRGTRRNVRNVDLNRNFPAKNFRASVAHGPYGESEPETKALTKVIRQFDPAKILAVHAPLDCVNYDGPAEDVARRMAESSGYPLKPSIGYPTPGSLGSYAGHDLRIPTITLELRDGITAQEAWNQLGEALLIFVKY